MLFLLSGSILWSKNLPHAPLSTFSAPHPSLLYAFPCQLQELDDVNEALSKELTEVDITQTSTDTTMTFTRPLTPEGDKTVLSAEEGDEVG